MRTICPFGGNSFYIQFLYIEIKYPTINRVEGDEDGYDLVHNQNRIQTGVHCLYRIVLHPPWKQLQNRRE